MEKLITKILNLFALIFVSKKYGETKAKKDIAEQIAKERNEDAKIDSQSFVSSPFSRMRRKKD